MMNSEIQLYFHVLLYRAHRSFIEVRQVGPAIFRSRPIAEDERTAPDLPKLALIGQAKNSLQWTIASGYRPKETLNSRSFSAPLTTSLERSVLPEMPLPQLQFQAASFQYLRKDVQMLALRQDISASSVYDVE